MLTFGPVPSRRLGRSLGINNIPPKSCTYSCRYCQVGPTRETEVAPRLFYKPVEIFKAVEQHLTQVKEVGETVDYLTFVPDGEPTLDLRLSDSIDLLRPLGIPIAVISNASLIWRDSVRQTLAKADWVSLKLDAIDDGVWKDINRPHASLNHESILEGMRRFAAEYQGLLVTESMLLQGLNDSDQAARGLANFLDMLSPKTAYLSVPTRPPAERDSHAPDERALNRVYQIIHEKFSQLELLTGYEGNAFVSTGNVAEDLLSITSVHPMREDAVQSLLDRTDIGWELVEQLLKHRQLIKTEYGGQIFYVRCLDQG
jgi:wyosine [tRNA(Phe)-imidazoG37] synthetase (radical SAM superfamily)